MPVKRIRQFILRPASKVDRQPILALLNRYHLITEDLNLSKQQFYKIEDKNTLIAIGALECHVPYALIRSVAVNPAYLKQGHAIQICDALYTLARIKKISTLYLLTQTASQYFHNQGFDQINRRHVPISIQKTEQFNSLCPADAVVMIKHL